MKILRVEAEFFHTDRHTDGQTALRTDSHDEANSHFINFADTSDYTSKLYCTLCNYCTNGDMFRHQKASMITRQCFTALISYFIVIRFNAVKP